MGAWKVDVADWLERAPSYVSKSGAKCGTLENARGLKLATFTFEPSSGNASALVLLCHGIGSHVHFDFLTGVTYVQGEEGYTGSTRHEPKFEASLVERLTKMGYIVAGMDHQSYGSSEGPDGLENYFEEFDDLIHDQILFRKELVNRYPDIPVFVIGLSMGGCVATRLVQEDDFEYRGCVLLAPMLSIEKLKKKCVNKLLLPVSGLVSKTFPTLRIAQKEPHVDEQMHALYKKDPLTESASIRARVANECLNAVEKATSTANVSKIHCSLLLVHSVHDTMTDPEGSEWLYQNAPSQDKTLELCTHKYLWHSLLNEPGKFVTIGLIESWLTQRAVETATESQVVLAEN